MLRTEKQCVTFIMTDCDCQLLVG